MSAACFFVSRGYCIHCQVSPLYTVCTLGSPVSSRDVVRDPYETVIYCNVITVQVDFSHEC